LVAGGRQVVATIVDKSAQADTTYLLAAADGKERVRFRARDPELFVDLSEDGRHTLLSAISKSQELLLRVRQPDGRLIWQGGTGDPFPEARLFAGGRLVVSTTVGKVETWDVTRGRRMGPLYVPGDDQRPSPLAVSPDGRTVLLEIALRPPAVAIGDVRS